MDSPHAQMIALGDTEVIEVRDPRILSEVMEFRVWVWRATNVLSDDAFPQQIWTDSYDNDARHWIARDAEGRLVGAARLTVQRTLDDVPEAEEYRRFGLRLTGPIAAPDRVVVCRSAQGQGIGRSLLDAQDQAARAAGANYAVRQASPGMARLLRARGWTMLGAATIDPRFPGLRFQVAMLRLATDPRRDA